MSPAPLSGSNNLISRNEEILLKSRKSYYDEVKKQKKNEKRLEFGQYIGKTGIYPPHYISIAITDMKIPFNLY